MQIFNQINARSLTDRWDVLSECKGSRLFMSILLVEGGLQALLVELGGPIMRTTGLTPAHWGLSLGLAAVTFPLGVIMRYIPVPSKPSDYAALYQDEFAVSLPETTLIAASVCVLCVAWCTLHHCGSHTEFDRRPSPASPSCRLEWASVVSNAVQQGLLRWQASPMQARLG